MTNPALKQAACSFANMQARFFKENRQKQGNLI